MKPAGNMTWLMKVTAGGKAHSLV